MANSNSPTIVSASLSDEQLKKSIDSLVTHVDEAMKKMVQSTNNAVGEMEAKLKSLGNLKIDNGGSADGGASKRAKAQNEETEAVEKTNAARDKQIRKNQEVKMSYDQMQSATQSAANGGKMSVIETYDMQIKLLIGRLREVRQDIDIFNAAIGSGKKTQVEWGRQGLKEANAEAERLMKTITTLESQRGNLFNLTQPQGHTIQNYVNSLQKANPELALLNEQFKRGKSLLQQQKTDFEQNSRAQKDSTNQSKKSLDEFNAAVQQSIAREQERRDAIRQTGLAARETANQLIRSAHEQASAQGNAPITGTKELQSAIEQMRRAYFDMSTSERTSPIGMALEADIKRANDAITVIRKYNQSLFGAEQGNKHEVTTSSTLGSLRESLKALTDQYNKLTVAEIRAGKGDELIKKYQEISRAAHVLQRQLSTPISFEAINKFNARSLDDIAYKMQMLRSYRQSIDLTKPSAANEIKQVDEALAKLQRDADKWMSKSQGLIRNNTALGRSWNYMKNRLAFYFSVGASTSFIKNLIEVRSQYEMNERALGVLIDSAEKGTQIFNELSQMALVSPYTLIELSSAAKQLTAYDVAAKDVVDTTRRLADMAAAVGIPIERLTYALGQIKAYGYLNSRDARMFANAGIPLVKQLSDYYTEIEGRLVSTADVYDRIKKKAVDYNEVMEVINKMTDEGGKFFDFQAKMADTLKVRLANLTLAWNNMLNDMGKESQGVLTWGIGALRELFLHWKQFNSLIENAAWALGIRTAFMFIAWSALKAGAALGVTSRQMALSSVFGTRLAGVLKTVGGSLAAIVKSPLTWWSLFAIAATEALHTLLGVNEAQKALNESIRNGAKDNYDNISKFLEQYREIRESLYKDGLADGIHRVRNLRGEYMTVNKSNQLLDNSTRQDIDQNEAKKAWEAIREQIELTVASSDKYIGNLLSISNMSERVRQGFNLLDDIQVVNAALKELDDDTIKISKDWSAWWNAYQLPDGLGDDINDVAEAENKLVKAFGSISSARERGGQWYYDYENRELSNLRKNLKKTTDSIIDFIELKSWSHDTSKINQVFEQITQKIISDNQLDPQKAFILQSEVEAARSDAARKALLSRIHDEKAALEQERDENAKEALRESINANVLEYNNWNDFNGRKRVEWERFTKWLKEQHISETTAMFRNMDAEDIKSLNFQEGKYAEWVTRMVTQYAKEHKMSYDEAFGYLKSWVSSANQWSIFIPLTISTEDKKSVYDQLGEYDKAVDEADAQIERLTTRIGELNAKKKKSKEETQELALAEKELADAQKAKAEAEAKGGHGKKEKKNERENRKNQKEQETELQKALKEELSLIDKVRSIYKDLTKEGMSHANAVERATKGWDETVNSINKVLLKNGLSKLDLTTFVGVDNPRDLVNILQKQLDKLVARGAKPVEIKELQTKIQTLNVDADKYDLTKITKGLNSELDKLKDEYELALELDANPELGDMFADWMDIDINDLPRTAQEYANEASKVLNRELKKLGANIELTNLLSITDDDMRAFEQNKTLTQEQLELVKKAVETARGFQRKETKDRILGWGRLLEKYAEYEVKVNKIHNDAVKERVTFAQQFGSEEDKSLALNLQTQILAATDPKEKQKLIQQLQELVKSIAGDDKAKVNLITSIDNSEQQGVAKANFEEFQKSPEWITATGDLAGMTTKAIGYLISSLERYKKTAKNLDPKQIKQINSALRNLHRQQRQGNPFLQIADAIDRAKARAEEFQPEMDAVMSNIIALEKEIGDNDPTEEQAKHLQSLKDRWKDLAAQGEVSATEYVDAINASIAAASQAISMFADMADALGGQHMTEATQTIKDVTGVLEKAGQGAAMGAQIGKGWGALIGGVAGGLAGLITTFSDMLSGNKAITDSVKDSERDVRRLELAYVDLQHAVDKAYGTAVIGAKQAILANKELQLAEIQRQIELEKSRKSKNRDEDRIIELEKQYKELFYEIRNGYTEIVDDLMGTDVASFAENLVSSMIDAFKQGEDYMQVFSDKFDEMIDNMIMKSIVSRVVSQYLDDIWEDIDKRINERTKEESEDFTKAQNEAVRRAGLSDDEARQEIASLRSNNLYEYLAALNSVTQKDIDDYKKAALEEEKAMQARLKAASAFTGSDVDYVMQRVTEIMPELGQKLKDILGEYYKFGESSETQLGALQQGLQSMSESTANALEAYANSISQQAYMRNDLLTQIRDTIMSFDMDVQLGVFSQMLLQLQNNYIIMQSMHSMMENWTIPSGSGIRVELLS